MQKEAKYLYSLPDVINPPSQSKLQELPFDDLSWENFERLILRYVEQTGKLEHCHLYGKKGQKQEGIDLFIRHNADDLYSVYQCKRYRKYSKDNLQKAVKAFREGTWLKRTKRFYICTACDLSEKSISDEIELQQVNLREDGVELLVLDKTKLSNELKILPQLVYDFFGKEWTRLFCGDEYLSNIGHRLEPNQILEYRTKLGAFYSTLFENHETSLRNISGQKSTPRFTERYIIPDINKNYSFDYSNEPSSTEMPVSEGHLSTSPAEFLDEHHIDHENLISINSSYAGDTTNIENRMCAIDWLAAESNSLIVGGAGSGKSALLKYITLGLLGEVDINNSYFIKSKNKLIPVWLPFSYWSNFLELNANSSILDCLRSWFSGMAHDDLWPLMETAIKDNRLLLIVDGIDEWKSEQSALVCMQKLSVFISERNASSIISSRPSGVEKLRLSESIWSASHLEGLSVEQQNTLIKSCIEYRLRNQVSADEATVAFELNRLSQELISEIAMSQNLTELASVPLLLYMLIHLKSKNISLPHSRYKVYRDLVNDLVKVQPKRRKVAAQVVDSKSLFTEAELISILSNLAYELHVQYPHGSIDSAAAKAIICAYLTDENMEFGFSQREAQRQAESFLDITETEVGILVKKSPNEVGFFHRALQEFLAAYHISTQADETQENVLKKFMFNKQWKDVFLGLFTLLERPSDVEKLVKFISEYKCQKHEEWQKEVLLAEIAFGDNKCSAGTAKSIASNTFEVINNGPYMPHRRALLNILLAGIKSNKLSSDILEKVRLWAPENQALPHLVFRTVEKYWPVDELTQELLLKGFELERLIGKRVAAETFIKLFGKSDSARNVLIRKIKSTLCFDTRMALYEAVIRGWPDSAEATAITKSLSLVNSPVSELLVILYETINCITSENNKKRLLEFIEVGGPNLEYAWRLVAEYCIELAYLDEDLKNRFCKRIFENQGHLDRDFCLSILIKHYHNDDAVQRGIIDILQDPDSDDRLSLAFDNELEHILNASPEVMKAVELEVIKGSEISDMLCKLVKTPKVRKHLLKSVEATGGSSTLELEALVKNWGIADCEVKKCIGRLISKEDFENSLIANLYPFIFPDQKECFGRLMQLIEDDVVEGYKKRYDLIIRGILEVADEEQCELALELLYRKIKSVEATYFTQEDLLLSFGEKIKVSRIREIALGSLKRMDGLINKVAAVYFDDDSIRKSIVDKFNVLPVSLRGVIFNKLSQINTDDQAWQLLRSYENEIDPSVRTSAAIGYYSSPLAVDSRVQKENHLKKLKSDLGFSGRRYLQMRQTALCGLVALGQLNESNFNEEPIQDRADLVSIVTSGFMPNEVFYSYLAKNWNDFDKKIGFHNENISVREKKNFLRNIAPYVDSDSPLIKDLKQLFHDFDGDFSGRILMAASKLIPKEKTLLNMCFHSLGLISDKAEEVNKHSRYDNFLAIHILEQQFFDDPKAKQMLTEFYDSKLNSLDVILISTYAIGYSEAPFIKKIKAQLKSQKVWIPALFPTISQKRKNKDKIELIDDLISQIACAPKQYARYLCKTVASVVNNSDSLYLELIKTVKSERKIHKKLRLLALLNYINSISPEVKEIAIGIFESQRKKKYCDSFYDVTMGKYSTSLNSLSRILYGE